MVRYCQQFLSQLVKTIAGIAVVGCFWLVITTVFSGLIHHFWPVVAWGIAIVAFSLVYTWWCVEDVQGDSDLGPQQ